MTSSPAAADPRDPLDDLFGSLVAPAEAPAPAGVAGRASRPAAAATPLPGEPVATPGVSGAPGTRLFTVLVVDPDRVARRFAEHAFTGGPAGSGAPTDSGVIPLVRVLQADGLAAAVEVLRAETVDAVVSETELRDGTSADLRRRLDADARHATVPLVVMSADARLPTKLAAFAAGATDFVSKPCDPRELAARVRAHEARQRRLRAAAARIATGPVSLAGEFETLGLPDLLGILEMGRRSGVVSVLTPRIGAHIVLDSGLVVHAVAGRLTGIEAIKRLLGEVRGHFDFTPAESGAAPPERTIDMPSTSALIIEAARLHDEQLAGFGPPERIPVLDPDGPPISLTVRAAPRQSLRPTAELVRALRAALADEWALGELRLFTSDEAAAWTTGAGARERFHVQLLCDRAVGVPALAAMAAGPSERDLVSALDGRARIACLNLFVRGDRLIDVLLVDPTEASLVRRSLGRLPALTVFVPPGGDPMRHTPSAMIAVEKVLLTCPPAVLFAVGHVGSERYAATPPALRDALARGEVVHGRFGEDGCDLKSLLGRGIERWGRDAA